MTTSFANPAAKVELERVFDAPPARVFEAWSRADLWSRWFPPDGFTMTVQKMDFQVGGTFEAAFHSPEMPHHAFSGTYQEIVPGEKLVWTAQFPNEPEDQMLTTITFREVGGKTEVKVVQAFRVLTEWTAQAAKGAPIGWGQTLDHLAAFLAG